MSEPTMVTPGGNPICPKCGNWYVLGQKDSHPCTVDRDDLAAILAKHRLLDQFQRTGLSIVVNHACSCGDWNHPAGGDWPESHRAHVAQMVLESDWLRGVRAKELRDAADEATCDQDPPCGMEYCAEANEITAQWLRGRADRVDAEDTDNTTDRT